MLILPLTGKSVVAEDETKELQDHERLAAIQRRLEMLMRDAREIRGALTELSDRDPFAILKETLEERARRARPPSD